MNPQSVWWLVAGCAAVTVALKALGPVITGGRELPCAVSAVLSLTAPALVAALVATQTLTRDGKVEVTESAAGVAVAGMLLLLRVHALLAAAAAVAATAALRMY